MDIVTIYNARCHEKNHLIIGYNVKMSQQNTRDPWLCQRFVTLTHPMVSMNSCHCDTFKRPFSHTPGRKTKILRVVRLVQAASCMSKFGTSIFPGGTISTMVQPPKTFGRPPRGSTIGRGAAGAGTAAGAIATAIAAGWIPLGDRRCHGMASGRLSVGSFGPGHSQATWLIMQFKTKG